LCRGYVWDFAYRLNFYHDFVKNQQIELLTLNGMLLVYDIDGDLTFERNLTQLKFVTQGFFVN